MHFLFRLHLLGGVVIDLAHRAFGRSGLCLGIEQLCHQELLAGEFELLLELVAVADLLGFGRLRQQDHVADISNEIVAF